MEASCTCALRKICLHRLNYRSGDQTVYLQLQNLIRRKVCDILEPITVRESEALWLLLNIPVAVWISVFYFIW